ncbi:aldose epimerase family protein [Steroidobacter sp.]|uniref:aldose epimerase family protein n=1 Tax=Steroidobacter sp. TaxID=1978227 RepID=UPI001A419C7A|nr:aldose epimerase family protein [Steroidobacter sp.]MBL8267931.1 galactose mutarotase [Steroidobacter sp.]
MSARAEFGALADGRAVESVELANAHGMVVRILTLGGAIQQLLAPDRNGKLADVVLGYATAQQYLDQPQYFGSTVGRYANRIAGGEFTLDGKHYQLETNDGPNHLHGGSHGFDKVLWQIESVSSGSPSRAVLSYTSVDGEGGYPGTLQVTATYTLNDQNELAIEYRATTDQPTLVNITNHSFFNLAGDATPSDVFAHRLTLFASHYTPVDETLIPTGERRPVAGTAFDFRTPHAIGERIRDGNDAQLRIGRGYDHNYIVDGEPGQLRPVARVEESQSGRVLELFSTAPGVQFYSGNFLNATSVGKSRRVYRQGDGFCLEPQAFPDSPNRSEFGNARLNPGQTYLNCLLLRFSAAPSVFKSP